RPTRTAPELKGELQPVPAVASAHLHAPHDVVVYLPPGYDAEGTRRYPVLYLQDGQNLFDPRTAFIYGQDWRLGETIETLLARRAIEPLLVVAVANAGALRLDEYAPSRDAARGAGGKADLYGRFLVEELKPYIDWRFRTRPGAADTGIGGSSMGGLLALHLGLTRSDSFGRVAALSPSVWWGHEEIALSIASLTMKLPLRVWLDAGTREGPNLLRQVRRVRDQLTAKGWRLNEDFGYLEARGASHDERAWGARAGKMLRFLFPPRRSAQRGLWDALAGTESRIETEGARR
ncbi:MAG: alpha/beta hydrolase-fold protein, partial [Thermoanaerobaculia bacterium]